MSGPKKPALGAAMTKVRGEAGPKDVERRAKALVAECKALGVSHHAVVDAENLLTVHGRSPARALAELEQVAGVLASIRAAEERLPPEYAEAARRKKAELLTSYIKNDLWLAGAATYINILLNTVAEAPAQAPAHTWKTATPTRARRSDSPPSAH